MTISNNKQEQQTMEEQQQPQTADVITGEISTYCTCGDEYEQTCEGECIQDAINLFCEEVDKVMFNNHYGEYLLEGNGTSDVKQYKNARQFLEERVYRMSDYNFKWKIANEKVSIYFWQVSYHLSKVTYTSCAICPEDVINENYALDTLSFDNPNTWKAKHIIDGIVYCCDECAKYATQPHYITARAINKNVMYQNLTAVIAVNINKEEAEEGTDMCIQAKDLYNNDGYYLGTIGFISERLQGNTWQAISITGIEFV